MNRRNFLARIASTMGVLAAAPALVGPIGTTDAPTWGLSRWRDGPVARRGVYHYDRTPARRNDHVVLASNGQGYIRDGDAGADLH